MFAQAGKNNPQHDGMLMKVPGKFYDHSVTHALGDEAEVFPLVAGVPLLNVQHEIVLVSAFFISPSDAGQ